MRDSSLAECPISNPSKTHSGSGGVCRYFRVLPPLIDPQIAIASTPAILQSQLFHAKTARPTAVVLSAELVVL